MRRVYIVGCISAVLLFCLALWKNSVSYPFKSRDWRVLKSTVDVGFVILAALYLPALLVAWAVTWLTRGISRNSVKITLAVLLGIVFHAISGVALEILCVLGIFSVDLLTGAQGIYGWWTSKIPDDFLSGLADRCSERESTLNN